MCNAIETLLVHADVAAEFLPRALGELRESGVELRVDGRTRTLAGDIGDSLAEATEEDWATEYHALILAVKVVDSLEEAHRAREPLRHRPLRGDRHRLDQSAQAFTAGVDAACVYVNASTRFTDGGGVRDGRRDRQLHSEAPRARADRRCAS